MKFFTKVILEIAVFSTKMIDKIDKIYGMFCIYNQIITTRNTLDFDVGLLSSNNRLFPELSILYEGAHI